MHRTADVGAQGTAAAVLHLATAGFVTGTALTVDGDGLAV
jgi:hypothetical protein